MTNFFRHQDGETQWDFWCKRNAVPSHQLAFLEDGASGASWCAEVMRVFGSGFCIAMTLMQEQGRD